MGEMLSGGHEFFYGTYEDKLAALFEKKRAGYLKFAKTLLLKKAHMLDTDNPELAKDLVQETFLYLLKNQNLDFSRPFSEIDHYTAETVKQQVSQYLIKYYRSDSKNPLKIPEKSYVPLKEIPKSNRVAMDVNSNPHLWLERQIRIGKIDEVLKTVSPRHEKIIRMRFGLVPYAREHTLEEVGDEIGVTSARVHQLELQAFKLLRHPVRKNKLAEVNP